MGGADPLFRFHALICEVLEIEQFYSVYLFTIPVGLPASIFVRVCERGGLGGGGYPPFRLRAYVKGGVLGGSWGGVPSFSVARANMRSICDRIILLSILIHHTCRNTCIDFDVRR